MSTGPNENESQGHPAWQELLDGIPTEFHASLSAKLADMDKRSQAVVQGTHEQYAPYKEFTDANIPPEVLKQSLYLANQLQNDPEAFVKRAIENFGLEGFTQAQIKEAAEEMTSSEWDGEDISQHPMFQEMKKQLDTVMGVVTTQQQESNAQKEQREFDEYMEGLKEKNKERGTFDPLFVASLMANDVDGDAAVDTYFKMIDDAVASRLGNQAPNNTPTPPPVVLGGSGNAGSGSAAEPVKMGSLSSGDTQDLVVRMLEEAAKNNQ